MGTALLVLAILSQCWTAIVGVRAFTLWRDLKDDDRVDGGLAMVYYYERRSAIRWGVVSTVLWIGWHFLR